MKEINKRLVEVDEVLGYLNTKELEKIPKEIRQMIKSNKDKNYIWKYDKSKKLKEQNLSRDTFAFLSYLNLEYLLNEEQKKIVEKMHMENERKEEIRKREIYKTEDLFNKNEIKIKKQTDEFEMVKYKENILKGIINKIKNILKIRVK